MQADSQIGAFCGQQRISPLNRRLQGPARRVSVADLAAVWFQASVVARVGRGLPEGPDPARTDRLRGAFGRALMDCASPEAIGGQPCPWDPVCALDVLWGDHGTVRRGVPVTPPFRLSTQAVGPQQTDIRVDLFGFASDWVDSVADALIRACRSGVAWDLPGQAAGVSRQVLPVVGRWITADDRPLATGLSLPRTGDGAVDLVFSSPLYVRRGAGAALDPLAVLTGLSRRAEGMARWHDADLQVQGQRLADAAAALQGDVSRMKPLHWLRPRTRGRSEELCRNGYTGRYRLSGPVGALTEVLPLLLLGEQFGAGSHTALGQGRYRLAAAE